VRAFWPAVTVAGTFALTLAAVRFPGVRRDLLALAVWMAVGAFVAVGWAWGRSRGWVSFSEYADEVAAAAGRQAGPVSARVTHETPAYDAVPPVTPCCSVPLAELPPGDHFSHNLTEVTCGGADVR
jgi:hypothetical protein